MIKKSYLVVFKIWAKKKSGPTIPSHPIHPIPSSVNKIGGGAWYPVAGVLGESTERLLKSLASAHKYRACGTNTCNFLINGYGSTMDL